MFLAQNLSIVRKPHVVAVVTFAVILLVMFSPFYPLLDRGSPNYKDYYKQLSLPGEFKNKYIKAYLSSITILSFILLQIIVGSSLPDTIRHSELFRLAHAWYILVF